MTPRQWVIVQCALLTFHDALRRRCGFRWDPEDGKVPTQAEVDEAVEALALEFNLRNT